MKAPIVLLIVASVACGNTAPGTVPPEDLGSIPCLGGSSDSLFKVLKAQYDSSGPQPRLTKAGHIVYPEGLRANGTDGWLQVEFVVLKDGTVDPCSIHVMRYSDAAFIDPGVAAVRDSRFEPQSRPMYVRQKINWRVT